MRKKSFSFLSMKSMKKSQTFLNLTTAKTAVEATTIETVNIWWVSRRDGNYYNFSQNFTIYKNNFNKLTINILK